MTIDRDALWEKYGDHNYSPLGLMSRKCFDAAILDIERQIGICCTCHGTGRVCVGTSGKESDGNAPEFERCPECGYGD